MYNQKRTILAGNCPKRQASTVAASSPLLGPVPDVEGLITRELRGDPGSLLHWPNVDYLLIHHIIIILNCELLSISGLSFTRFLLRSRRGRVLPWSWPVLFNALWMKDRTGMRDITDSRPKRRVPWSSINSPGPRA
jgi:hypothetical protein